MPMTWAEICSYPSLQKLPYKIEMSRWGTIEASPLGVDHARYQARVAELFRQLKPEGTTSTQAAVETSEYVKVSDVVWASKQRYDTTPHAPVWQRAPEICVELVTPGDPPEEGRHKAQLYLNAGAEEFWICNERGETRFYNLSGALDRSQLCPSFPTQVELPD